MNAALIAVIITVALWLAALWSTATAVLRGWSHGRFAARSRSMLALALVDAVVLLVLVRALAPPPGVSSWLWVAAWAVLAVAAVGGARRWPSLPAFKPRKDGSPAATRTLRAVGTAGYLIVGAGLVVVLI